MSWQMRLLAGALRATRRRSFTTREAGERLVRQPKGSGDPPRLDGDLEVDRRTVAGFPVHLVRGRGGPEESGTVVFLHGGAYVAEMHRVHWLLVAELAGLGRDVLVPHYGLAPDHGPGEAHRLVHELLLGIDGPVYLVGDSAGGGLALAATQTWLAGGGEPPRGLTLIAPWLDLAIRNPEVDELERHDPWLARPGLRACAEAWAGEMSMDDPRVSPLFGSMEGLPPIDLYVGTRDIGLADARLLAERAPDVRYHEERGAGEMSMDDPRVSPLFGSMEGLPPIDLYVGTRDIGLADARLLAERAPDVRYHEERGAVHVYPLLPFVPEGARARARIRERVRTALS